MTALTHRITYGGRCEDCGVPLLETMLGRGPLHRGDLIGRIETTHGGVRTYKTGEHDSNERCVEEEL